MTRHRTFKSLVRARMSKTGERYTTARRHVIADQARTSAGAAQRTRGPREAPAPDASPAPAGKRGAGADDPRGAVSDARIVERTGHGLAHWFAVLDRFGGIPTGHTAMARHLREAHDVPGWYSQGITVAYERARGGRSINQRPDGAYDFGASKILAASVADVRSTLANPRIRRWTDGLDAGLVRALADGVASRSGRGFVPRSQGQTACRFPWGTGSVEVLLTPLADGRTRLAVQHGRLRSLDAVAQHRQQWKAALAALATAIGADPPAPRPRSAGVRTRQPTSPR
ncbi:MAG: hypothetical protein AB7O28_17955 [Vicinamibacterales bacterium]